jgi:hypothetical protein
VAGELVEDARMIIVQIRNSGNVPIAPDDYIKPLRITLPGAKILTAAVQTATSDYLRSEANIAHDSDSVVLSPLLLNDGDELQLAILTSGHSVGLDVEGRIIGVSQLTKAAKVPWIYRRHVRWIAIGIVCLNLMLTELSVLYPPASLDVWIASLIPALAAGESFTILVMLCEARYWAMLMRMVSFWKVRELAKWSRLGGHRRMALMVSIFPLMIISSILAYIYFLCLPYIVIAVSHHPWWWAFPFQ